MGAHDFQCEEYGASPEEAYKIAVDNALYECGHNPYNGTISTTDGFVMIPFDEGETPGDWFERVIDDERVQKWTDCACAQDPYTDKENGSYLWHFAGWAAC
jgi:hypothetical protein